MNDLIIFAGRSNVALAEAMAKYLEMPLGNVECKNHSDGEIWVHFVDNIRGKNVAILQTTPPPAENFMELLIMIDAAKRASARKVIAVIPYFGYARQERKDQPRVSITAKLVANLLTEAGADRVITIDLHSPAIQGFFDIPVDHLYGSYALRPHLLKKDIRNLAVVACDLGGIKMARAWSKKLGAELVVVDKRRPRQNESEVVNIIGDVDGKNILMVDDLIDTAGTLVNGAVALKEKGALDIFATAVHPVLSGKAYELIEKSPIKMVTVTDTIPIQDGLCSKLEVVSVSKLLAEAVDRAARDKSVSSLFEEVDNKS